MSCDYDYFKVFFRDVFKDYPFSSSEEFIEKFGQYLENIKIHIEPVYIEANIAQGGFGNEVGVLDTGFFIDEHGEECNFLNYNFREYSSLLGGELKEDDVFSDMPLLREKSLDLIMNLYSLVSSREAVDFEYMELLNNSKFIGNELYRLLSLEKIFKGHYFSSLNCKEPLLNFLNKIILIGSEKKYNFRSHLYDLFSRYDLHKSIVDNNDGHFYDDHLKPSDFEVSIENIFKLLKSKSLTGKFIDDYQAIYLKHLEAKDAICSDFLFELSQFFGREGKVTNSADDMFDAPQMKELDNGFFYDSNGFTKVTFNNSSQMLVKEERNVLKELIRCYSWEDGHPTIDVLFKIFGYKENINKKSKTKWSDVMFKKAPLRHLIIGMQGDCDNKSYGYKLDLDISRYLKKLNR